jgi:uncharacterized protein
VAIALGLTDYQRAVADRLLTMTGAGDFNVLAAAAVDHDRRRAPDPCWAAPRPTARPVERPSASVLLDLTLPAATAAAVGLRRGDHLRIEQLDDGQGVDLRAFATDGTGFSAGRTRANHGINPTSGAVLWTAASRPLLTIVQDSAPGHDLLFPACTEMEYAEHAGLAGHLGCDELHRAALVAAGRSQTTGEDVLNLWLPSAVDRDGRLRSWPAACRTGDFVTLRADADVLVTLSCCPDDLFGTSQYEPKPVRVTVTAGRGVPSGLPSEERPTFGWPSGPPPSAIARHELAVELSADDLEHVDRWAERGWLGCDRREVTRALIFRLHESLRAP